jgi:hypothetical protein
MPVVPMIFLIRITTVVYQKALLEVFARAGEIVSYRFKDNLNWVKYKTCEQAYTALKMFNHRIVSGSQKLLVNVIESQT